MGHFIYVMAGIFFGIIIGFVAGVWATQENRDKEKWNEIRCGWFLYDDRVYHVHLRGKETD